MICSRCRSVIQPDSPIRTDGETPCSKCPVQDASVIDFLWQFPVSRRAPEVLFSESWFFMIHELSIVAIHDEAWPTLYEDERYVRIHPSKFPATALFMNRVLNESSHFEDSVPWSKLRKTISKEGATRFFGEGIEVANEHLTKVLPLLFAETSNRSKVKVGFVDVGLRFEHNKRVAIFPTLESVTTPSSVFFPGVLQTDISETADLLTQLDTLLL